MNGQPSEATLQRAMHEPLLRAAISRWERGEKWETAIEAAALALSDVVGAAAAELRRIRDEGPNPVVILKEPRG